MAPLRFKTDQLSEVAPAIISFSAASNLCFKKLQTLPIRAKRKKKNLLLMITLHIPDGRAWIRTRNGRLYTKALWICWNCLDHDGCVEGLNGTSQHGRATAALACEKITD